MAKDSKSPSAFDLIHFLFFLGLDLGLWWLIYTNQWSVGFAFWALFAWATLLWTTLSWLENEGPAWALVCAQFVALGLYWNYAAPGHVGHAQGNLVPALMRCAAQCLQAHT